MPENEAVAWPQEQKGILQIYYFFANVCVHIYIDTRIYNSGASVCKIQSYSHLLHLVTMKILMHLISQRSCNCLDLSKLCLL